MLIEHTFGDRPAVYIRFAPASLGWPRYAAYAEEAIRHGTLVVRVTDDDGFVVYRRTVLDSLTDPITD